MADETKILQIIPAQNWFALVRGADGGDADLSPVACFALFETGEGGEAMQMVRPMGWADGVMQFLDQLDGFEGLMRNDTAGE
ncbi:MAG: hypothetical protein ACT4P4_03275 [Betaproteobacteria bacterium]